MPLTIQDLQSRTSVIERLVNARLCIQDAVSCLEKQTERDTRKIQKLYNSLKYLLKAEDNVKAGYPATRKPQQPKEPGNATQQ